MFMRTKAGNVSIILHARLPHDLPNTLPCLALEQQQQHRQQQKEQHWNPQNFDRILMGLLISIPCQSITRPLL